MRRVSACVSMCRRVPACAVDVAGYLEGYLDVVVVKYVRTYGTVVVLHESILG